MYILDTLIPVTQMYTLHKQMILFACVMCTSE